MIIVNNRERPKCKISKINSTKFDGILFFNLSRKILGVLKNAKYSNLETIRKIKNQQHENCKIVNSRK